MDWYYLILINALVTVAVGSWLFKYFEAIYTAQADVMDKIIKVISRDGVERIDPPPEGYEMEFRHSEDSQRTHILGGIVDFGTHKEGRCSDECWCHEEE